MLKLEDAVRKMTALPAEVFRLKDRGTLKPGAIADVVVFDPLTVTDPSTFEDPHHHALGFSTVLVNGIAVIADGNLSEARPGRAVRRGK